jgi:hypothetical protein
VVWKTKVPVRAQPWSPFIPGNEGKPDKVATTLLDRIIFPAYDGVLALTTTR